MRILYDNYVKTATITPLSEVPGFDFDSAFTDTRLSRFGRTVTDENQTIVFDLGSARSVYYCAIIDHNFTSGATVKIQGNASDSWGAPSVDVTLTIADAITYNWSTAQTYRYWRLSINDASNPDGFLDISKVYLGSYLQMPYMSRDMEIPTASTSDVSESTGLQVYGDPGIFYQYGNVNFPVIEDDDKILMDTMFQTMDKYIPYILLIWENDLTSQPPLYVRNTNDFTFKRVPDLVGKRWSLTFSFKQCF